MFNYIKETIINDAAKIKEVSVEGELRIPRVNNYKVAQICEGKIFKTPAVEGKVASFTINVGTKPANVTGVRMLVFISTPKEFVEYAYPNYQQFGKPFVVETSTVSSAQEAEKALAKNLALALPYDNPMLVISGINVKTAFSWLDVKEVRYEWLDEAGKIVATSVQPSITHAVAEFGTANWLIENLRFPSQPNLRFTPLYADEAPIKGAKYTQYAFEYLVPRATNGGMSAVGQLVDSVTSHVFYVNADAVTDFEGAITKAQGVTLVEHDTHAKDDETHTVKAAKKSE